MSQLNGAQSQSKSCCPKRNVMVRREAPSGREAGAVRSSRIECSLELAVQLLMFSPASGGVVELRAELAQLRAELQAVRFPPPAAAAEQPQQQQQPQPAEANDGGGDEHDQERGGDRAPRRRTLQTRCSSPVRGKYSCRL